MNERGANGVLSGKQQMRWLVVMSLVLAACTAEEAKVTQDFAFDGTCVTCHAGLSAGHVHGNYKLRCIDCHGGNDQVQITGDPADAAVFRNPMLVKSAHVQPKKDLAHFFFANGVDDNGNGIVDEGPTFDGTGATLLDPGETFEPGLHGEGAGEFIDTELSRDLNYVRFMNPGDLRVASIGCGSRSRAALDGGGGGGCHQETVDIARRNIMVNQSAVINGAYYGNENWRSDFQLARDPSASDPRAGAFGYSLDYDGVDACIDLTQAQDESGRGQPHFNSTCLEARASSMDPSVAAGAPGNVNLPAFEIARARSSRRVRRV